MQRNLILCKNFPELRRNFGDFQKAPEKKNLRFFNITYYCETSISQSQRCNRYVAELTTGALVKAVYILQLSAVTTFLLN